LRGAIRLPEFTKWIHPATNAPGKRRLANHGGFTGVGFGDDEAGNFPAASLKGDRQRATNAANATVERQLSHKEAVGDLLLRETAVGAHNTESHRQVES